MELLNSINVAAAVMQIIFFCIDGLLSCSLEQPALAGGFPEKSKVFIAMLCVLVCMHLYWFALIVRIAWASLVLGDHRDTREDDN